MIASVQKLNLHSFIETSDCEAAIFNLAVHSARPHTHTHTRARTHTHTHRHTHTHIYIYIYIYIYIQHHHVVPPARISLALSRHFSLSFIASGRSSEPHPVSSHGSGMYVRAGRPAFEVHPIIPGTALIITIYFLEIEPVARVLFWSEVGETV